MKIKITYNLEDHEDRRQYEISNKAKDFADILVELAEYIDVRHYDDGNPIRDKFRELLKKKNIDINKL